MEKLPPAAELRRIYLTTGVTLVELAKQYGVCKSSVVDKLETHARREGLPWPLRSARPDWQRQGLLKRWDGVPTDLLREEIAECVATHDVTLGGLASLAGLSDNLLWRISAGINTRVSRSTAEALVAAMDSVELAATGADWATYQRRAVAAPGNAHRGKPSGKQIEVEPNVIEKDRIGKQAA